MKFEPTKKSETSDERQEIRAFTDETLRLLQLGKQDQTTIARISITLHTTVGFRYFDFFSVEEFLVIAFLILKKHLGFAGLIIVSLFLSFLL
jgi:hypothetical protein